MSKYPEPKVGTIQEFMVNAIAFHTDSLGAWYELFTVEGPNILVGVEDGEPVVHVDGRGGYSGPHAHRVLKEVREMFKETLGYDPEEAQPLVVLDKFAIQSGIT